MVYFIDRMRHKFLIIPAALMFQVAGAQNSTPLLTPTEVTVTAAVSGNSSTPVTPDVSTPAAGLPPSTQMSILDYKSVYEAATVEEEVKMATERFELTPSQQDVWLSAATDRREGEKQARDKFESKASSYEKEGAYRGLRSSQNTFHETIIGYLAPAQKHAYETDRLILQERQKKMAKLPPPAPTVTVAPVDSSAIKEAEKNKDTGKKAKKKKKTVKQ